MTKLLRSCVAHTKRENAYQSDAISAYYVETAHMPEAYSWITTTCGNRCLNVDHMKVVHPTTLAYPAYVCIYCGRSGYTKDHLFPRHWSGDTKRRFVAVVPACGTCNAVLSDTLTWSITERRAIAHHRLRKHYRKALRTIEYGEDDLNEFGDELRSYVVEQMAKKRSVMEMLEFPEDPGFDLRACQKSGIEDPYEIGLLISTEEAMRIAREVA